MKPEKTIDADAFAKAFRDNMAKHTAEPNAVPPADVKEKMVALMAHAPAAEPEPVGLLGVDLGDFCANWLRIKAGINRSLWFAQFFMGAALIAQIKTFVVTFERMALPLVCPTPPAE